MNRTVVILHGEREVGKSTLAEKLGAALREKGKSVGGVIQKKIEDDNMITGILVEDFRSGETEVLARCSGLETETKTGRYFFEPGGLIFANKALENAANVDVAIVDEYGPLESRGLGFTYGLDKLKESNADLIVLVRTDLLSEVEAIFKGNVKSFFVTHENRDHITEQVLSSLEKQPKNK